MRFIKKLVLFSVGLAASFAAAASPTLIRFSPSVIEVDTIRYDGGVRTVTFTYTNVADKPVTLVDVYSQCGCTVPEFTRKAVAPGATATIKVTLNPYDLYGEQKRHLTVISTNGDYRKFSTITVHGYVERDQTEGEIRFPYDLGCGLRTDTPVLALPLSASAGYETRDLVFYNDTDEPVRISLKGSWRLRLDCPEKIEPRSRISVSVGYNTFLKRKGEFADSITPLVNGVECTPVRVDGKIK